jgi:hypothetical protein
MAIVLVGIYTLMALSARDVVALAALWVTVGYCYGFVRVEQGQLTLPKFPWPRRGPKLRVLPKAASSTGENAVAEEMDRLLDKIAKTGLSSLSATERARLEKAREALLRREGH